MKWENLEMHAKSSRQGDPSPNKGIRLILMSPNDAGIWSLARDERPVCHMNQKVEEN